MIQEREDASLTDDSVDLLLTVSEIAKDLRLSKMTVYRLIHGGELSAIVIRGSYRVRSSTLKQFLLTASSGYSSSGGFWAKTGSRKGSAA